MLPDPLYFTGYDGHRVAYRRWGTGKADRVDVLCLSGTTRNGKDFRWLAEGLSLHHRVLAMDWRGCGASDHGPDWRSYMPMKLVQDVLALMTLEGLNRVVIVGTSLGGAVGMAVHLVRPAAIAGLVLNDIGPEITTNGLGRIWDVIGRNHVLDDWAAAEAWCHKHFPPLNLTDAQWRILAENTFVAHRDGKLHMSWDPQLAETQRRLSKQPLDLWPLFLATRRIPVFLVRGEISDILSAETAAKMTARHPRLDHYTVKGCGHTPNLSAPDIMERLHDFFARCDAS